MKTLFSVLGFFPYILQAVKAVEDNFASEPGASKKQLVLDSVLTAAKIGEQVPQPTVALVTALIDSTVSALNASGIFKKATPAPVA